MDGVREEKGRPRTRDMDEEEHRDRKELEDINIAERENGVEMEVVLECCEGPQESGNERFKYQSTSPLPFHPEGKREREGKTLSVIFLLPVSEERGHLGEMGHVM
ncbi:hypothetical protein DPEC_G00330720 [Dallia pectoralis]|uniref:Uncharacterized protein n=1 Tax=Dallia pectoralis TaxID=75939 RepID=A0ACC2F930_DALPE|nr:hypothetical protein DPEC_G00330720 [Dallia pectoralis]